MSIQTAKLTDLCWLFLQRLRVLQTDEGFDPVPAHVVHADFFPAGFTWLLPEGSQALSGTLADGRTRESMLIELRSRGLIRKERTRTIRFARYARPDGLIVRVGWEDTTTGTVVKVFLRDGEHEFLVAIRGLRRASWAYALTPEAFAVLDGGKSDATEEADKAPQLVGEPSEVGGAAKCDFPNPSRPMSKTKAAEQWGGDMTADKIAGLMRSGQLKFTPVNRQTFVFCLDNMPGMPGK